MESVKSWTTTWLAVGLILAWSCCAVAKDETLPDWFLPDAAQPYKIFDAWKHLTTRDAVLYLNSDWKVLAGILRDESGKPIPNCPLTISMHDGIRGYGASLRTDRHGYFLIYSPYQLRVHPPHDAHVGKTAEALLKELNDEQNGVRLYACPGFPGSQDGEQYGRERKAWKPCVPTLVREDRDRSFYVLTATGRQAFDEDDFARFKRERYAADAKKEAKTWSFPLEPWHDDTENRVQTKYTLQFVSRSGTPVPKVIVNFGSYDGFQGNHQVVETDEQGRCTVEEWLRVNRSQKDDADIRRDLVFDAPGHAVGGFPKPKLTTETVNKIVLETPATVTGKLLDHQSQPIYSDMEVVYKKPIFAAFALRIPIRADGSFAFQRIMPGAEFKIAAEGISHQVTPIAPVETEFMVLKPGDVKKDILLCVPLAAALRGIVVAEDGQPILADPDDTRVTLAPADERGSFPRSFSSIHWLEEGTERRFGLHALGTTPFRICCRVPNFEEYRSDVIQLEPGELRFVKLTLKRSLEQK